MTKTITYCPRCMNDNKHTVLFNTTRHDMDFPKDTINYSVNECDGCGYVTMLYEELDDMGQIEVATYPDDHLYGLGRYHQEFLKDQQIKTLPKMIRELYLEVQTAINNESLVLSGVGLRTLVESICVDRKVAGRSLENMIETLRTDGYIAAKDYPVIDKLRVIGNHSTHRMKKQPMKVLIHALRVVNHMINAIYFIPRVGKQIKIKR